MTKAEGRVSGNERVHSRSEQQHLGRPSSGGLGKPNQVGLSTVASGEGGSSTHVKAVSRPVRDQSFLPEAGRNQGRRPSRHQNASRGDKRLGVQSENECKSKRQERRLQ